MRKLALGFTLIELLVVISIIGILTTLVAANLNSARSRARDAARKSDIRNIATGLRLYFNDWATYPTNNSGGQINGCSASGSGTPASPCTWGQPWANGAVTVYMNLLPKDPLTNQNYYYKKLGTDTYQLGACLENLSDTTGVTNDIPGLGCPDSNQKIFEIKP